jgi:hypothetical protein
MHELAETVCYWLSYKAATGASRLLTEGSLSIPIAESLFFHRWEIFTETDYHEIFDGILEKKIYADFYAKRGNEQLVLETKFFKSSCHNRVFNDIVRLGLADFDSVSRVLLLAWSAALNPWNEFRYLLELKNGQVLTIDPNGAALAFEGKMFTLNGNRTEFERLCSCRSVAGVNKVQVTCTDRTTTDAYGAAEYAIRPI